MCSRKLALESCLVHTRGDGKEDRKIITERLEGIERYTEESIYRPLDLMARPALYYPTPRDAPEEEAVTQAHRGAWYDQDMGVWPGVKVSGCRGLWVMGNGLHTQPPSRPSTSFNIDGRWLLGSCGELGGEKVGSLRGTIPRFGVQSSWTSLKRQGWW